MSLPSLPLELLRPILEYLVLDVSACRTTLRLRLVNSIFNSEILRAYIRTRILLAYKPKSSSGLKREFRYMSDVNLQFLSTYICEQRSYKREDKSGIFEVVNSLIDVSKPGNASSFDGEAEAARYVQILCRTAYVSTIVEDMATCGSFHQRTLTSDLHHFDFRVDVLTAGIYVGLPNTTLHELLAKFPSLAKSRGYIWQSPLCAAVQTRNVEIARFVLGKGANIADAVDPQFQ